MEHTKGPGNLALIAAAPELLEACKGALAALTQPKTFPADIECARTFLRAAIARATGDDHATR